MKDDDLDRLLNQAAPPTSLDRQSVCRVATDLAYEVAASSVVPVARRRHRLRATIGLSIAILLTGGTAAIASPLLLPWLPWSPDSLVERDFTIASGEGASCVIATRINPDAQTAGPDQTERLERARRFLGEHDWSDVTAVSISDLPAHDVEMKRRQGVSDSLIVAMSISDQISTAFSDAGLLGEGVSLEQAAHCEPAAAE